jgi:hypothetical protein
VSGRGFAGVACGACGTEMGAEVDGVARCVCGVESRVFRFRPFRVGAVTRPAPLAAGAPCAYHAGNEAVTSCARCGSFLCTLCATPVGGTTYCTACFERLHAAGGLEVLKSRFARPHAMALAASLLALIPLFGLLFAPIVVWQGVQATKNRRELSARERGLFAYLAVAALFTAGGIALSVVAFRSRS